MKKLLIIACLFAGKAEAQKRLIVITTDPPQYDSIDLPGTFTPLPKHTVTLSGKGQLTGSDTVLIPAWVNADEGLRLRKVTVTYEYVKGSKTQVLKRGYDFGKRQPTKQEYEKVIGNLTAEPTPNK